MMGVITGAATDVCLGGISGPAITTARRFGRIAWGIHPLASGLAANERQPLPTWDNRAMKEMAHPERFERPTLRFVV